MKYRWDKKYLYWGITGFLVIIASISFYYFLFHGTNIKDGLNNLITISMPILNGLGLAYLLTPLLNKLEKKLLFPAFTKKGRVLNKKENKKIRALSILMTMIIVFFIAYAFFAMVIPQIIKSIQSIVFQFPIYVNNLNLWISEILSDNPDIEVFVSDIFTKYSAEMETWLNSTVIPQINELIKTLSLSVLGLFKALWNFIIGLILSVYILFSKELLTGQSKKIIYALFERKTAASFINNVRFTHRTFSGFLGGKIVDSIIIGILCFICTNLIGTPYPVLISVIIGVTNVIPFFGPYLGAVPSAILILMVDPIQCLYFIIFIFILQQFDGNILGPKILGDSTGLSSFWVICAITVFGGFFGIFGMFIGVPTFAIIYAAFKAIFNRMLRKKGLSSDTNEYIPLDEINEENEFIDMIQVDKKGFLSKFSKKEDTTKDNQNDSTKKD